MNAHVVITGGSSGIGLSVAKKVVMEGGHVTIIARYGWVLRIYLW